MSNPRFQRHLDRRVEALRAIAWQIWVWLVSLINEWILPEDRGIDAEAIAAWCQQYLADRDPGELQFRGMTMAPQGVAKPSSTTFAYRGLMVAAALPEASFAIAALPAATAEPFVPVYQQKLRSLLLEKGWQDMDKVAATPSLQTTYRGRAL